MKLILLGAPGAGKGTQAEKICQRNNIPTISTGNILREALKSGTEMGLKAKTYMESGQLVPDEILIGIIKDRLAQEDCKGGFILDGFPRTIPQAEALDNMGVEIDAVLDIEVADEDIITRMSGRRVCESCGSSYHVLYKQPKEEGKCDICGGTLVQRKDDHPEALSRSGWRSITPRQRPLKEYYSKQGKLLVVHGQDKVEDTTRLVMEALEDLT